MTISYPNSLCRKLAPTTFVLLGCKSPWRRSLLPWRRTRRFLLRIFSRSNALLVFGVQGGVMCTSCPTSPDISARDSRLRHSCGDTTSVRTLCTSQAFLTVNTKTTSSCVTERVYCAYLFVSSQHVIFIGGRFSVCPRTRSARRDQPAFKIKSILKGTEYDGG